VHFKLQFFSRNLRRNHFFFFYQGYNASNLFRLNQQELEFNTVQKIDIVFVKLIVLR
jgi:hypothetical protein